MYFAKGLNGPSSVPYDDETIPVFSRWIGSWRISLQRRALSAPQLTRSYDLAAPQWSRKLDRLGVPAAYEAMLGTVLSEEAPSGAAERLRVLDCGVGTGALSSALTRVLRAPFALDAIDISPRMLERASRRLRGNGVELSLRQGDARALPYSDGQFDLVMCGHVLEHLADPQTALGEMVRVLKPGGLFIVCLTRRSLPGLYVHLKWRTHRVTPAQAERWLLDSGLEHVRSITLEQCALFRQLSVACVGRKPIADSRSAVSAAHSFV